MFLEPKVTAFGVFCIILQFLLIPALIQKTLGARKAWRLFDVTECVMSLIMSSLVGACSLMSLSRGEDPDNCHWFRAGRHILLCYLLSHLLYCMWHEGFNGNTKVWICHHVVTAFAMGMLNTTPVKNLRVLNFGTLFMELSNPFTNLVFVLQHLGYSLSNSKFFILLCAAWIASFIVTRLCPIPYMLYNYLDCYLFDNSVALCTDRVALVPLFLMYLAISFLNLYWFSQMVSGAFTFLFDKSALKENPLNQYKNN